MFILFYPKFFADYQLDFHDLYHFQKRRNMIRQIHFPIKLVYLIIQYHLYC